MEKLYTISSNEEKFCSYSQAYYRGITFNSNFTIFEEYEINEQSVCNRFEYKFNDNSYVLDNATIYSDANEILLRTLTNYYKNSPLSFYLVDVFDTDTNIFFAKEKVSLATRRILQVFNRDTCETSNIIINDINDVRVNGGIDEDISVNIESIIYLCLDPANKKSKEYFLEQVYLFGKSKEDLDLEFTNEYLGN